MTLLWEAAERGNVPAMRILLDLEKVSDAHEEPDNVIDELAKRRRTS